MLFVVVGPSGSGKSTLIQEYHKQSQGQHVRLLTSTTTRGRRGSDMVINRTFEYEYVTEEEFNTLASEGKFLKVFGDYGNCYGTKREYLETEGLWGNRNIYFAVLLIEGAQLFLKYALEVGHAESIRFIYLDMQDEVERKSRLRQRGEMDPKRYEPELATWRKKAQGSGVPFIYCDSQRHSAHELARNVWYDIFGPGRTE